MITSPSPVTLLRLAQVRLTESVAPHLSDPAAAAALAQVTLLLANIEVVADHELDWLRSEIADIHDTAEAVIAAGADADGTVARALSDSRAAQTNSLDLPSVRREYGIASDVLSVCLEVGIAAGGPVAKTVVDALQRRVDRQNQIKASGGLAFTSRVADE